MKRTVHAGQNSKVLLLNINVACKYEDDEMINPENSEKDNPSFIHSWHVS
jgi:hypothetical protein